MKRGSYWTYSAACALIWALILFVAWVVHAERFHTLTLVALGFAIAWVSGTLARWVYPPPKRWRRR